MSEGEDYTLFATDTEDRKSSSVYTTYDEDRRTINYVETGKTMESHIIPSVDENMNILLSSAKSEDLGRLISDTGKYFVYSAGEISDIFTNPAEAIMSAYYNTGSVITEEGCFYRRASRPNTVELTDFSVNKAAEAYRDGNVVNLTGIYLTQARYFTGKKIPVIWEWYGQTYIIYGYDLFDNLMMRNIDTGENILVTYDEIDMIFDISGRCFIPDSQHRS